MKKLINYPDGLPIERSESRIDITKLNARVLNDLRDALDARDDDSQAIADQKISQMAQHEMLDTWLTWNGIIGYTNLIEHIFEITKGQQP